MTKTYTPEDRVRMAARHATEAQQNLAVQIQDARAKGLSLRAIAAAAGMSHEKVRGLISQDQS